VLPPEHRGSPAAAAAGSARRHSVSHGGLRPRHRRSPAEGARGTDARRRAAARRGLVGRQRPRAAQRDRARLHPRRRRLHHRARAGRQHAAGVLPGIPHRRRGGRRRGRGSARQRRAGAHPARAAARQRQQEGRGADAGPQPARAVPPPRAARPRRHDHAPPRHRPRPRERLIMVTYPLEGNATAPNASVLVVDDEPGIREILARWLATGGYDVQTASSADEALQRVHDAPPAVALCDIRMPGHDGLWLARHIRRDAPETAVIMATGMQDVSSAVTSLRQGVIDYLTKPFGRDRLRESVLRGIEWHRAATDSRRWRETLDAEVDERRGRLRDVLASLTIDSDAALDALLGALTLGDRDAYAHAYRVAALAASVGCALALPAEDMVALERAAL